ncbi:hypothetical protein PUW25_25540 (plasmid) [Paenibacillus urinalis]|uniref:Acetyltransferase n=1 Tax=Paenibacillus urinalis TaxID=521520 RepID=A0ABY7XNF3_9BACL|nr:hypothetical protein [Paenibacillus urinalis]WDI05175.1 hypothetical protein PUW25_25540 [Paenibacillus urinalis]
MPEKTYIPCVLKNNRDGRIINQSFTPRQLLTDFYDENELAEAMVASACNCQPIGETYDTDCNCFEEWENYSIVIGIE